MNVNVRLYGILRDKLPEEAKGRATLELKPGATVADVLRSLEITRPVAVAVNEDTEVEQSFQLSDGDEVAIFSVIGGG